MLHLASSGRGKTLNQRIGYNLEISAGYYRRWNCRIVIVIIILVTVTRSHGRHPRPMSDFLCITHHQHEGPCTHTVCVHSVHFINGVFIGQWHSKDGQVHGCVLYLDTKVYR